MNPSPRTAQDSSPAPALPDSFHYLLIPGFGGTGRLFAPLIATGAFPRRPEIHAYPAGAASVAEIVDSLLATQRAWNRTVIIAESLGGVITAALCARLATGPEATAPAALVFSAAFATSPRPALLRLARWIPAGVLRRIGVSGAAIRAACLGGADPALVGTTRAINDGFTAAVWRQRLAMIETADVRSQLARIAVPACYLRASHDRLIPARASHDFCSLLSNVTRIELSGPHFLLQTAPRACITAVARFLATIAPAAPTST